MDMYDAKGGVCAVCCFDELPAKRKCSSHFSNVDSADAAQEQPQMKQIRLIISVLLPFGLYN